MRLNILIVEGNNSEDSSVFVKAAGATAAGGGWRRSAPCSSAIRCAGVSRPMISRSKTFEVGIRLRLARPWNLEAAACR